MMLTAALSASHYLCTQESYVYGTYIDDIIAKIEAVNTPTILYYHTDRQFNVRGLTDSTGNIKELYAYSVYGQQTIMGSGGVVRSNTTRYNNYGFTGRYLDDETGLWYFRARYFDDELGRFISRDPLGYVDGMSLYGGYFAEGFAMDPSGEALCGGACIAALAVAAARAYNAYNGYKKLKKLKKAADALKKAKKAADKLKKAKKAADVAKKAAKFKVKCEGLYQAYKKAEDSYGKNPCKRCLTCAEVNAAIAKLSTGVAGRAAYIKAGCDKVDWGTGGTPQSRKQKHWKEYRNKVAAVANCWKKHKALGCSK